MGASNGQFSFSYLDHHLMALNLSFSVAEIFDFASCQIHAEDEIREFLLKTEVLEEKNNKNILTW